MKSTLAIMLSSAAFTQLTYAYSPYTEQALRKAKLRSEKDFGIGQHYLKQATVDRKLMSPSEHSKKYLQKRKRRKNKNSTSDDEEDTPTETEDDDDVIDDPRGEFELDVDNDGNGCKDLVFNGDEFICDDVLGFVSPCYWLGVSQGLTATFYNDEEFSAGDVVDVISDISPCVDIVNELMWTIDFILDDMRSGRYFDGLVYTPIHVVGNFGAVTEACNFSSMIINVSKMLPRDVDKFD